MSLDAPSASSLNDPELLHKIQALRGTDNVTNWLYILREYLVLALTLGGTIVVYQAVFVDGLSYAYLVPVTLTAWIIVGATQHRLATLGHEAVHYILFRHRLLNELASDLLCMFPLLSSTQYYRPQHLGHHQFVNDPEHDPDLVQLEASGHRFQYPMSKWSFVWHCVVKQLLWPPLLLKYIWVRGRFAAGGVAVGPYRNEGGSKSLMSAELPSVIAVGAVFTVATIWGTAWQLAWTCILALAATIGFYLLLPERAFPKSRLKPDVPPRWMSLLRMTYMISLFAALAWLNRLTGMPWGLYYFLLWIVPLGTTFSWFMILRQIVQHDNAGRERLTNSRIFFVSPFLHYAVFPLGMDYHLPHHLFPLVPHYRLPQLHALLMENETYRQVAPVVDGYFFPRELPPTKPTVLDLLARESS